jgi:membrane-associated phospholipid phosphatase
VFSRRSTFPPWPLPSNSRAQAGLTRYFGAALTLFRHSSLSLIGEALRLHLRHWKWQLALLLLATMGTVLLVSFEQQWHFANEADFPFGKLVLARWLYEIGKTDGTSLFLILGLSLSGLFFQRANLRRTALTLFLAILCTGALVNLIKPLAGRVRPSAMISSPFTGPHWEAQFHSFPSGHSSEAFSLGTVLVLAYPPSALVVIPYGGTIAWSRLYLHAHEPSDVFAGATLAMILCWPLGLALRRRNQRFAEPKRNSGREWSDRKEMECRPVPSSPLTEPSNGCAALRKPSQKNFAQPR